MGDKELLNRARNDKSAKESELSFTNPVNYALKQNNSKAPRWLIVRVRAGCICVLLELERSVFFSTYIELHNHETTLFKY